MIGEIHQKTRDNHFKNFKKNSDVLHIPHGYINSIQAMTSFLNYWSWLIIENEIQYDYKFSSGYFVT